MIIDNDTVAIITGAGSGIGRALAVKLANEGASIALADKNRPALEETAGLLGNLKQKVSLHSIDVSDRANYETFVSEVKEKQGAVNLLINNAGVGLVGTTEQLSIEDIEWLMGINFWGVVYGVKYFLPILKQQPRAHIVNISSVFGLIGPPGHPAYSASKFAVRGFTETLRHELKGSNITVTVVHPGGIDTNIAADARIGKGSNQAALERERKFFKKAARTSPQQAAERIVRGIERNEERILVGIDAIAIDKIQRWIPVKYWKVLDTLLRLNTKDV